MRRSLVVVLTALLCASGVARAQDAGFVPLSDVAAERTSGRMLFFPLPDGFDRASPYALLPATGRRLAWTPESAELSAASLSVPPLRPVGSPPSPHESARYLVPVLDGSGAALEFLPRRLDAGRLVPYEGTPKPGLDVVPVLTGPRLDPTPSETPLERVLGEPVEVDATELADAAPAVLVRKATPSRVVFGVRLGRDVYVPLIGESGLAVTARHNGRRGVAAPLPGGLDVATLPDEPDDEDASSWPTVVAVAVAASVVVGGLGLLAWRRGSRHRPV
jgi:hypothetical protein